LNDIIRDAGFEYEFASISNPPVVKYVKALSDETKVEIEFITDEPGGREGVKKIGSINAQALRNVGILMADPWKLDLAEHNLAEDGILLVPRPATYLLHKAVVAPKRRHKEKTAKDLYYLFSTIDSEGINLIITQRLQTAFPDMTEDQFRQYVVFTVKGLIESLRN
jgi:hypothetical protein